MVAASNDYERLYLEFFATLSSGDLERIRATFHEDAIWQVQVKGILGEGTHRGRNTIVDEFLAKGVFVESETKARCTTPCAVELPKGTREAKLVFKLAGYTDEKRSISTAGDLALDFELVKRTSKPQGPARPGNTVKPVGDNTLNPFE